MSIELKYGLPVLFEGLNHADCRKVFTFWDDFLDSSSNVLATLARWKATWIGGTTAPTLLAGTNASQELSGGILSINVEGTDSDVTAMLVNGRSFQMALGHELYFECRWTPQLTTTGSFVGLGQDKDGNVAAVTNGIGFRTVGAVLYCVAAKTTENADTISSVTVAALTWMRGAIHYDGIDTVRFYFAQDDDELTLIDTMSLTLTADYVPDDIMLTPVLEAESQTATASGSVYVDYVLCQQARQRVAD